MRWRSYISLNNIITSRRQRSIGIVEHRLNKKKQQWWELRWTMRKRMWRQSMSTIKISKLMRSNSITTSKLNCLTQTSHTPTTNQSPTQDQQCQVKPSLTVLKKTRLRRKRTSHHRRPTSSTSISNSVVLLLLRIVCHPWCHWKVQVSWHQHLSQKFKTCMSKGFCNKWPKRCTIIIRFHQIRLKQQISRHPSERMSDKY